MRNILFFIVLFTALSFNISFAVQDWKLYNPNTQKLIISSLKFKELIDERFPTKNYNYDKVLQTSYKLNKLYTQYNVIPQIELNSTKDSNNYDIEWQVVNYNERLKSDIVYYFSKKLIQFTQNHWTEAEKRKIKNILSFLIEDTHVNSYDISTIVCPWYIWQEYDWTWGRDSSIIVQKEDFWLLQLTISPCEAWPWSSLFVSFNWWKKLERIQYSDYEVLSINEIKSDSIIVNAYKWWIYSFNWIAIQQDIDKIIKTCEDCNIEFDKTIEIQFADFKKYITN